VERLEAHPELDEGTVDLKTLLCEYERHLIRAALDEAQGNQRRAAEALGVLPTTLSEKMKRLGLRSSPLAQVPASAPALAAESN
jgi:DNA-binding NtrC family response regulator